MNRQNILQKDLNEVCNTFTQLFIKTKLFYYSFQRLLANFILRHQLSKVLSSDPIFNKIDNFL